MEGGYGHCNDGRPDGDPDPASQKIDFRRFRELVETLVEHHDRSGYTCIRHYNSIHGLLEKNLGTSSNKLRYKPNRKVLNQSRLKYLIINLTPVTFK